MDINLNILANTLFLTAALVGFVLVWFRSTIRGNRSFQIGAIVALVLLVLYTGYTATSWPTLVLGLLAGVLLGNVVKNIAGFAILAFLAAFMFFYGFPYLNSWRTVAGIHAEGIHDEALKYADAAKRTFDVRNRPVVVKAESGELNLSEQRAALRNRGQVSFFQQTSEKIALLEAEGVVFGDFGVPVTHVATDNPLSWFDTGKQICGTVRLKAWGKVNSDGSGDSTLDQWVDARGWVPGVHIAPKTTLKGGQLFPLYWKGFAEVYEPAPYMALMARVGTHGPVFHNWQPIDADNVILDVRSTSGCQRLYMQFNDFRAYDTGLPYPEGFARNKGTQSMSHDFSTKEGLSVSLEQLN